MTMSRVIGVAAAAGCAALAIAGCGTIRAGSLPSAAPKPATPQQRASADAASILSSFVPPPGAVRLTAAPGGALRAPAAVPAGPDVVHDTSYWRVSGSPQSVLTWEKAHLPRRFTATGSGTVSGPAIQLWDEHFTLPSAAGVLTSRGLEVAAVKAGGGRSALRVDAAVTWVPAKPASERIPAAAKVVTISPASSLVAGAKVPSPVTITNATTVRRIAALIDGLPLFPPGAYSCPADLGRSVQMTFAAVKGGPPLAVATATVAGCQGVRVIIGGKPQPTLSGTAGAVRQVLAIAGLNWSGYAGGNHPPGGVNPGGVMKPL